MTNRLTAISVKATALALALGFSAQAAANMYRYTDENGQIVISSTIPQEATKRGYGLGFKSEYIGDRQLKGHSGGMPGNITRTLFDTDDRIVVSVLSNSHGCDPMNLHKGIWHILDKYKSEYDPSSPFLKYHGRFYDVWGSSHFVPMGKKIYVTLLNTLHPFKDCSELEHIEGNIFTPAKESGYGNYGQNVEFIMNENNEVKTVNYAGILQKKKEEYEAYIKTLKEKYNNHNS